MRAGARSSRRRRAGPDRRLNTRDYGRARSKSARPRDGRVIRQFVVASRHDERARALCVWKPRGRR